MTRIMLTLVAAAIASSAAIWHVPEDVSTIQAALDTLASGDTVLVQPRIYAEALQAPPRAFVILGITDSTETPSQPVIDPSSLDGSRSLACLTLPPESDARIEHVTFRNGPAMFPRWPAAAIGGIANQSEALCLRDCLFDSTYKGVFGTLETSGTLDVIGCEFWRNGETCITKHSTSPTTIDSCWFSATHTVLALYGNATIGHTIFAESMDGQWLWLLGDGNVVHDCRFGPTTAPAYSVIWTSESVGCIFENNVFEGIEATGTVILFDTAPGTPSQFIGNTFRNCHGLATGMAGSGIYVYCQIGSADVQIDDCTFDSCGTWSDMAWSTVEMYHAVVSMEADSFRGHDALAFAVHNFDSHGSTMNSCSFSNTVNALKAESIEPETMNAEFNWWGDNSGPHHAQFNPQGLGDVIVGPVDFEPWLLDTTDAAPRARTPLPDRPQIVAYPNPFNAMASLVLVVDQPGVYDVELYNTLGQRTLHVWSGAIAHEKQISLNASVLPSGVYFVRASRQGGDHIALSKIVLLK
jgi:hypothetical protein